MIDKINTLWRAVFEKIDDTPTLNTARNHINAASVNHIKKEELRSKGTKIPSKLLSLKYFETKEGGSVKPNFAEYKDHKGTIEVKEKVEEESEEEFKEETEEEIEEEEEYDPEYLDTFPTTD
nr:hypothetical protein [Tanacetum cinerariifolium]